MKCYGVKANGELQVQVFSEFDDAQEEARLCRIAGQEDAAVVELVCFEEKKLKKAIRAIKNHGRTNDYYRSLTEKAFQRAIEFLGGGK